MGMWQAEAVGVTWYADQAAPLSQNEGPPGCHGRRLTGSEREDRAKACTVFILTLGMQKMKWLHKVTWVPPGHGRAGGRHGAACGFALAFSCKSGHAIGMTADPRMTRERIETLLRKALTLTQKLPQPESVQEAAAPYAPSSSDYRVARYPSSRFYALRSISSSL